VTTAQLALDLAELVVPDYAPEATIQQRWEQWERANPWVIPFVEALIQRLLDKGHKRVGLKQCWEVVRYEYGATTGDRFKANNDFTSRAARLILQRHPEWAQYIETRELRAA
jgi:hypothetical protein